MDLEDWKRKSSYDGDWWDTGSDFSANGVKNWLDEQLSRLPEDQRANVVLSVHKGDECYSLLLRIQR